MQKSNFLKGGDKVLKNLIFALMIGIMLIFVGDSIFKTSKPKNEAFTKPKTQETMSMVNFKKKSYEEVMEDKLKRILSNINGVGKLEVMVTLDYTNEIILAKDVKGSNSTTSENDNNGGVRTITNKELDERIVFNGTNSNSGPIILKEREPVVKGVLVIAEGANNIRVKGDLTRACQTLLKLPINRICVCTRKIN